MHREKIILIGLILIGGASVVGSYIHGLLTYSGGINDLWGAATEVFKVINIPFMILAAIGFLAFTYFILFRIDVSEFKIANRFNYNIFNIIFALILFPSAFWMPLTISMIAQPDNGTWLIIRLILAIVGVSSIALLLTLLNLRKKYSGIAYWFSVSGAVAFTIQTFIFDTILWPQFF